MSTTTAYRIEKRWRSGDREGMYQLIDRDPLMHTPLTAQRALDLFAQMVHDHPGEYGPHGDFRLVLIGPDRPPAGQPMTAHRWGWRR